MDQDVIDERARCVRVARHISHMAKAKAMKFIFAGDNPTLLDAVQSAADSIADLIELGEDPGICGCESEAA